MTEPTALDDLAPLPRGRHSLTRDEVTASQRLRLAVAMADALAERGYAATPVAAVLDRAGVSRQTFYQLYDDKLDCFLDALDLVAAVLLGRLGETIAPGARPVGARPVDASPISASLSEGRSTPELITGAIERYLDTIVEHPSFARLYIVEANAAGPRALIRRAELQARVVDALAGLIGATTPAQRFACDAFVAAIAALVTLPVTTGDTDALVALRDPLVELFLTRVLDRP